MNEIGKTRFDLHLTAGCLREYVAFDSDFKGRARRLDPQSTSRQLVRDIRHKHAFGRNDEADQARDIYAVARRDIAAQFT